MSILVTGSIAIDHIMVFHGRFKDLILPDRIHMLNVAFHVPELRRTFGGCGANIAWNLRRLGEEPILLGTVGNDFDAYAEWLDRHGIRRDWIRVLEDAVTAGAYITTDLDDNQIVGFHAGAMDRAHEAALADVAVPYALGIVSPNGKRAMLEHARGLKQRGVPVLVDPGQGLPLFERDELIELIEGAAAYIVNDYEWSLTTEKTGLDEAGVARRVGAFVVTLGERGSVLRCGSERVEIPSVRAREVVDPTGCGDAYRAGFLYGMKHGLPPETGARIGSLMGALKIERRGTQCLDFDLAWFRSRFEREFGNSF